MKPTTSSRSATIWLVEDEAILAMVASAVLSEAGYRVREFGSAEAALALLDTGKRPDLLITDQSLPGMSGQQLARVARDTYAVTAILLATGHADGSIRDFPLLAKPYRDDELLERAAELLASKD